MKLVVKILDKKELTIFCESFNAVNGKWWWGKVGDNRGYDKNGIILFVSFPCGLLLDATNARVNGWLRDARDYEGFRLVPMSYFLRDVLPNLEVEKFKRSK